MTLEQLAALAEEQLNTVLCLLRKQYMNEEVVLKRGRYAGRRAIIDGVTFSDNKVMFLAMVTMERGDRLFLNSDSDSRCYWQAKDLKFTKGI